MFENLLDKDYILIVGMVLLVYILLIVSPKLTKLQLRGKKKRMCKACPSATHPWKFALLVFVLSSIGYFLYKMPTVQKMMS
jgi:hypothetical protein